MQENKKKESSLHSDIARKFDVPERKAKLAKYITEDSKNMSDNDDLPLYCICRTADIDRFMIMCDECEDWFHGDCIRITEREAKYIKYFYCKRCRMKNPFLKIKYRKNKKKEEKEKSEKKRLKEKKKLKLQKKRSESSEVHKSASAPILSADYKGGKYEKDDLWEPEHTRSRLSSIPEKKPSIQIYSSEEDNDAGITMETNEATWQDNKPEKTGKKIDSDQEEDVNVDEDFSLLKTNPFKDKSSDGKKCGKCENCLRKENCGVCDACFDRERFGAASKLQKCRLRRCLNKKSAKKSKNKKKVTKRKFVQQVEISPDRHEIPEKISNRFDTHASQNLIQTALGSRSGYGELKQCFGPGCTNAAILPSKYCSEACGRRLARNRLYQILPQRIQEWHNTPSIANEQGRMELERIRSRMDQAKSELQALEEKFHKLESIIAAGKSLMIDEKRSETEEEFEGETDQSIYCVVCGHSVSLKSAIKHMDRCYIKIESQMSFGSVYPTRIEGSQRLFCDVYNEQQQTYCKRLQVLCPEHTKEPKVTEDDVCGCPLSCNIYGENGPSKASHFCRLAKRKCTKHYKWETMYRAEVDLQRIRQWLKIDEIFDEERRIKTAMANRAGVVSLLLHQTIVHDPTCIDMRTKPTVTKKPAYRLMI